MSITYFCWWGFSINEGGTPVNIHISWFRSGYWFFIYFYFFGFRIDYMIERRTTNEQ